MAIQINNSPNARTGYRVSVRKRDFANTVFYEVWGVDTKTRAWLALARANKVSYERACYDVSFAEVSR